MLNAPVTMSIITEGAGTHFLMFLQHMIDTESRYYGVELDQTPIYSNHDDFKNNRWDTWTQGSAFRTPQWFGQTNNNIKLGGTSWNDLNNTETTEERLKYFNSIIAKHGGIHFGVIHYYPTWLEEHFSNINILFYLGETAETSRRCYNLFEIKNGHVPDYNPQLGEQTRIAVQKNSPICTVDYDDLYIKNDKEAVRKFMNFTLSTRVTEAQLGILQYWIDLYTTRNNELLLNSNK